MDLKIQDRGQGWRYIGVTHILIAFNAMRLSEIIKEMSVNREDKLCGTESSGPLIFRSLKHDWGPAKETEK